MDSTFRGSEWLRWEPHIHTPGTVLADGYTSKTAWNDYLDKLETSQPTIRAIGVTDYGVTASYERLLEYKNAGRLPDCELLFPNIELRLNIGTIKGNFVNIHLLVCPDDGTHLTELKRFLSKIKFHAFDDTFVCTPEDLRRLGRRADASLTKDEDALGHGCTQFKVSLDNLLETMRQMEWAANNIVIAVSGNADGTSGVREGADATLREEIEKASHAIFAGSSKQRDFWLGRGAASLQELNSRYGGPKPCIWGSDAHDQERIGNPDDGRLCWIKGAPKFDTLRQACIDPERAYVGNEPPQGAMPSQTIDEVSVQNASWLTTPVVRLNSGLVAIIGARGSGKTALADIIATGADAYQTNEAASFLARAAEHLSGASVALRWKAGGNTEGWLDRPVSDEWDSYPRARYLSQQFVEALCSIEGMPRLIREIERVIFEAHDDRRGAADFQELLDSHVAEHRATRNLEEDAIAVKSEQIGVEMDKWRQVDALMAQVAEVKKRIKGYEEDRKKLLPKEPNKASDRLQEVVLAADTVRGYLRGFNNQQNVLIGLGAEVRDVKNNRAPYALKQLREKFPQAGLTEPEWKDFLLIYSGDVDGVVAAKTKYAKDQVIAWQGTKPTGPANADGSYIGKDTNLTRSPLALLEAEIERLQKIVATDTETARKLAAISKKISDETVGLQRLEASLEDAKGAKQRAEQLLKEREESYKAVFGAIVAEEAILRELYAPLMTKLAGGGPTLRKIAFTLSRSADVQGWADSGEELFDLRTGSFKGSGTIEKEARSMLEAAWLRGDAYAVAQAMTAFLQKHQQELLGNAPYERTDPRYRPWTRKFAQWLYGTRHISLQYGITYGGIDIKKLSPGTRGIVLLLLYLALDDADDRPLIIDQPEENLDPQSVNDELVPLFQKAKARRQVVMVTHNANLVVNADADQVIVANVSASPGSGLPNITYRAGGLEEESIRKQVCEILEGGDTAFRERARRLRIALRR